MEMPKPIRFTIDEGGEWIEFEGRVRFARAHSIMFDNGMVFDMVNGWRKDMQYCVHCGNRILKRD